jgi:hypothetical protein
MQWQDAEDRARPDQHRQSEAASSASTIRIESTTRIEEPEDGSEDARAAHARQARREGAGAELRGGLQEPEAGGGGWEADHRIDTSGMSLTRGLHVQAERIQSPKVDQRTHGPRTRAKHRGRCRGGGERSCWFWRRVAEVGRQTISSLRME